MTWQERCFVLLSDGVVLLYKVKAQLIQWSRVARSRILRGGQRTLEEFVMRRASVVSEYDDGAVAADSCTVARADMTLKLHSREQAKMTVFSHARVATEALTAAPEPSWATYTGTRPQTGAMAPPGQTTQKCRATYGGCGRVSGYF